MNWIVAYDVSSPRRLQRIHRFMVGQASPIEYSVFLFVGTAKQLEACLAELGRLIDPRDDDVRCYALPARGLQARIGCATLPAGIQWTGLPAPWAGRCRDPLVRQPPPGALEWAQQQGLVGLRQVAHLDPALLAPGDLVIGTLPLHLAGRARARTA
jgi:CRISPR-associated protein Cas2